MPPEERYAELAELVHEACAIFRRHRSASGEATALLSLGSLATQVFLPFARREECASYLERSVAVARAAGEVWQLAHSVNKLGMAHRVIGDFDSARTLIEEALALRRRLGDTWGIATSLNDLAHMEMDRGDDKTAAVLYQESLELRRSLRHPWGLMQATFGLALTSLAEGRYAAAREFADECLAVGEWLTPTIAAGWVLPLRGVIACAEGDYVLAQRLLTHAVTSGRLSPPRLMLTLRGFARLAAAQRQWERALRLAGAAEAQEALLTYSPFSGPAQREEFERALAPAHTALDPEQAASVLAEGRRWSTDEAVQYALSEEPAPTKGHLAASNPPPVTPKQEEGGASRLLSPREREVTALVGRGYSNRQIAAELVIAERTAMRHVEHIMGRLGVHSRAQIAAWAAKNGLLDETAA